MNLTFNHPLGLPQRLSLTSNAFSAIISISLALSVLVYLVVLIFSLWSSLSLLHTVKERENKINFGEALRRGLAGLGSYIWVSFLVFAVVALGLILFIVPGIIFSVWFSLSLYVLVSENKKGISALKRSKELISGYVTAYFGRTLLFGLLCSIVLAAFSLVVYLFSLLSPVLSHIATIFDIIAAPLFVIFSFLVYESIKKAKDEGCARSPREIKYVLAFLLIIFLFVIPVLGIFTAIVLVNVNGARAKASDIQIQAYMDSLRVDIEMYAYKTADYSYDGASCLASPDLASVCNKIKEVAGSEPTIRSLGQNYCSYVKLPKGGYYCVDSGYDYGSSGKTEFFPGASGYCDGISFGCP